MSKSEKRAYFHHICANNFVLVHFFKTFLTDLNQREILCFLMPILNFVIKFFFALICTFCKL
jgi:hypothetical protein